VLGRHADRIAEAYGCGAGAELRGPLARGEQGEVWRLETRSAVWAVKLLFEQPDLADARADGAYQDAVWAAGVPMPRARHTLDGELLYPLDGSWVRVYDWVDLLEPDPGVDPAAVGALLAAIHGVRSLSSARPVDPWYTEPVGARRWEELMASLDVRGAPFADGLAELRDELVALEQLLAPPRDLQVCHRDLWADNVRATPGGGLCVIDWDNGGLADPSQELAIPLFEFGLGDGARTRALYDAYVAAGGPGRIAGPGDCSMLIAQLGHIAERHCALWLEIGAREPQRTRATRGVDEFLGRPLTRGVIDDLIAAVTG
jgi:Ser/Thr protein kinase RdoA (MazF antagonist)